MSHEHDRPDRRGAWYRKNPGDLGTDESIRLNFSVKIPMTPFLGCVGVAPAGGEAHNSQTPDFTDLLTVYPPTGPRPTERIRPSVLKMKANNAFSGGPEPVTVQTLSRSSALIGDCPATVSRP